MAQFSWDTPERRRRQRNGRAYQRKLDGFTSVRRLRRLIQLDHMAAQLETLREQVEQMRRAADEGDEWKQT
jgi:hypothetical protein